MEATLTFEDIVKKGMDLTPEEFAYYLYHLNERIKEKSRAYLLKEIELKTKTASLMIQKKLTLEVDNQKTTEWYLKSLVNSDMEVFYLQNDLAILEADLKALENEFKIAIEYIQLHKLEKRKLYKIEADF